MISNVLQSNMASSVSQDASTIIKRSEAENLLEEFWFFGNLLIDRKTEIMSRCYSHQEIPVMEISDEQNPSTEKGFSKYGKANYSNLVRAPSLPACLRREELNQKQERERRRRNDLIQEPCLGSSVVKEKEDDPEDEDDEESEFALGKLIRQVSLTSTEVSSPCNSLVRAPSLPTSIWKQEKYDKDDHEDEGEGEGEDEDECEITMGKLIRQASLGSSENLPSGHQRFKGITQSASFPKQSARKKSEEEEKTRKGHWKEMMRRQYLSNQTKIRTTLSEYHQFEQVQGCMNPTFTFDKKELNEDKQIKTNLERQRPLQRSASAIPSWDDNKSAEDLKAQIKFWARAVASNVR